MRNHVQLNVQHVQLHLFVVHLCYFFHHQNLLIQTAFLSSNVSCLNNRWYVEVKVSLVYNPVVLILISQIYNKKIISITETIVEEWIFGCNSYLHICCKLCTCLNRETGCNNCTRIGPSTGRRCKKNKYLPLRECSTAFSIKSTIVCDLNFAQLPKLKLPENDNNYKQR